MGNETTRCAACVSEPSKNPFRFNAKNSLSAGRQSSSSRPCVNRCLPRVSSRVRLYCVPSLRTVRTATRARKVDVIGPLTNAWASTALKRP